MSTPTTRSFDAPDGTGSRTGIATFVAAVRAQLDDLSADEVAELTGGLEADLADAMAESDSSPAEMHAGPVEYARELRAAAGLPPRAAGGVLRGSSPGLAFRLNQVAIDPFRELIQRRLEVLDEKPWWPGVRDFLVVLRPAWWVLRAVVAVQLIFWIFLGGSIFGAGFGGLVVLLGVIVISVQVGRLSPLPGLGRRNLVVLWNLVAAGLLLPMLFATGSTQTMYYEGSSYEPGDGLSLNGEQITNVFPYDVEGRPLTGVRLYDQAGRPIEVGSSDRTVYDDLTGTSAELQPGSSVGSAPQWNAFPLQQRQNKEDGTLGPIEPAPLPFGGAPADQAAGPPTPTLAPSAAPTPSAASAPSAAPAPSVTPTAPVATRVTPTPAPTQTPVLRPTPTPTPTPTPAP